MINDQSSLFSVHKDIIKTKKVFITNLTDQEKLRQIPRIRNFKEVRNLTLELRSHSAEIALNEDLNFSTGKLESFKKVKELEKVWNDTRDNVRSLRNPFVNLRNKLRESSNSVKKTCQSLYALILQKGNLEETIVDNNLKEDKNKEIIVETKKNLKTEENQKNSLEIGDSLEFACTVYHTPKKKKLREKNKSLNIKGRELSPNINPIPTLQIKQAPKTVKHAKEIKNCIAPRSITRGSCQFTNLDNYQKSLTLSSNLQTLSSESPKIPNINMIAATQNKKSVFNRNENLKDLLWKNLSVPEPNNTKEIFPDNIKQSQNKDISTVRNSIENVALFSETSNNGNLFFSQPISITNTNTHKTYSLIADHAQSAATTPKKVLFKSPVHSKPINSKSTVTSPQLIKTVLKTSNLFPKKKQAKKSQNNTNNTNTPNTSHAFYSPRTSNNIMPNDINSVKNKQNIKQKTIEIVKINPISSKRSSNIINTPRTNDDELFTLQYKPIKNGTKVQYKYT